MGNIEDIIEVVASASTKATKGANLFAHFLPETSLGGGFASTSLPTVAVLESPGLPAVDRFVGASGGLPAFNRPQFEVVVRSTQGVAGVADPRPARGLTDNIYRAILSHPPNTTASTSGRRLTLGALPPALVERDERGRFVFLISVDAWSDFSTST
jgi:hypothetical protein